MGVQRAYGASLLHALVVVCALCWALSSRCAEGQNPNGQLSVDASPQNARKIPDKMFGIFFEVWVRLQLYYQLAAAVHLVAHQQFKFWIQFLFLFFMLWWLSWEMMVI